MTKQEAEKILERLTQIAEIRQGLYDQAWLLEEETVELRRQLEEYVKQS